MKVTEGECGEGGVSSKLSVHHYYHRPSRQRTRVVRTLERGRRRRKNELKRRISEVGKKQKARCKKNRWACLEDELCRTKFSRFFLAAAADPMMICFLKQEAGFSKPRKHTKQKPNWKQSNSILNRGKTG